MLKNYTLRLAQESDAAALLKIYAPFVEKIGRASCRERV